MSDDEEVVDSGIVGYSELENTEEFKEELESAKQEIEELRDELNDAEREYEDLEARFNSLQEDFDPDSIKSDVIADIITRLNIDNMMTPQLEEWIENYCRFYLGDV